MGRRRISRGTRVASIKAAHDEFMRAPATGGYGNNEQVVLTVMGNESVHDCPTFDAIRLKYEKPRACTFMQAFKACWHGSRDWRDFDIEALRESHEEFQHFQLPERVQHALEREALGAHYAAADTDDEDLESYPPMELLHRHGRSRRPRGNKKLWLPHTTN